MNPQSPTLVASSDQRLADAVSFDCNSVVLVRDVRAFDPAGHTIAFWARWRDPSFLDPCLVENPGEDPYFTTSAATAGVFAYNDTQEPGDGTPRLTLSVPNKLKLANSGSSLDTGISLTDKGWHFVALAFGPADAQHSSVTAYVDGRPTTDRPQRLYHDAGAVTPNGKELAIGAQYSDGGEENRFCGNLAEFQVWQGALSAAAVAALMERAPDPASAPQLRVFLPLTRDSFRTRKYEAVGKYCGAVEARGFQ